MSELRSRPIAHRAPPTDPERGLALIEVVIAVGLLVTLAAGVVQLFAMSARSLVQARHRTSALILAVEKLEQVRAAALTGDASGLASGAGPQAEYLDPDGRPIGGQIGAVPDGSRFERVWRVDRPPGATGVVRVRVQVAPIRSRGTGALSAAPPPDGAGLVTLVWAP